MNCIIIEDEKGASDRLRKLIESHCDYLKVDAIITSIEDTIAYLSSHEAPSLIFMDIQLRDGVAFKIFDKIEVKSPVIFTTAYNEYALKAYKTTAIDYLLKPIKKDDLLGAIAKLNHDNSKILKFNHSASDEDFTYVVRFGNRYYFTELRDIAFIEEMEKLTILTRKDKLQFPINRSVTELDQELPNYKFIRISRKMIINIDSIVKIEYQNGAPVLLLQERKSQKVKVEKEFQNTFSEWLHDQYA